MVIQPKHQNEDDAAVDGELLLILMGLGTLATLIYLVYRLERVFKDAGQATGLTLYGDEYEDWWHRLEGESHQCPIKVVIARSPWLLPETRIIVSDLPPPLCVRPAVPNGTCTLPTGDERFDGVVEVTGNPQVIRRSLSSSVRDALFEAMSRSPFIVEDGRLISRRLGFPFSTQSFIERIEAVTMVLPHLKSMTDGLTADLSQRALQDPDPQVRFQALADLLRNFPGHPDGRQTLGDFVHAPDLETRLAALELAADNGLLDEYWSMICAQVTALQSTTEARLSALRLFETYADRVLDPNPAPLEVLRALLSEQPPVIALVERLFERARPELLPDIIVMQADTPALQELQVQAIARHARSGYSEAMQDLLIRRLSTGSSAVKLEAARVLGTHGNVEAVEPLLKSRTSGIAGALSGTLNEAIDGAVVAIQRRLGEGAAQAVGGLALEEFQGKAGGLSEAVDGRLSVTLAKE
ncbi:MAG: hypothetical protein ACE366_00400 [Bradymonadia bacterium]